MGQIFYWAKAKEGPLKLKCKSAQHIKQTVEQFGHVNASTLGSAQSAEAPKGGLEAGCLRRCWSPPVREAQSILLSPALENLAPQAWAIKRAANCGEEEILHRRNKQKEAGL